MSQFQRSKPPRNYLSRREQWRLLGLVLALGLVVILMGEARDPDNYPWFKPPDEEGKVEVRGRIREFLTPAPANVAVPVDHWVHSDREVLPIQPVAGDWENFDAVFDFDNQFEAGEQVVIELCRGGR